VGRNIHRRKSPSKNTGRNASENARRIKFTSQSKFSCQEVFKVEVAMVVEQGAKVEKLQFHTNDMAIGSTSKS
jgi:hypothetical protein